MANYVTSEQAKWLKEIGFDYHKIFQKLAEYYDYIDPSVQGRLHESDFQVDSFPDDCWIPVPEQHQVVEWLRLNHGLWIHVHLEVKLKGLEISNTSKYQAGINRVNHTSIFGKISEGCIPDGPYRKPQNSPQEAYSAAFDYLMNNKKLWKEMKS